MTVLASMPCSSTSGFATRNIFLVFQQQHGCLDGAIIWLHSHFSLRELEFIYVSGTFVVIPRPRAPSCCARDTITYYWQNAQRGHGRPDDGTTRAHRWTREKVLGCILQPALSSRVRQSRLFLSDHLLETTIQYDHIIINNTITPSFPYKNCTMSVQYLY